MRGDGQFKKMHTHENRLALLLHEEQLSPVSGSCLHPKHHQVAQRQHPQERGEEELPQGALPVAWAGEKRSHGHLNYRSDGGGTFSMVCGQGTCM